jgi:hypothetical protein
LPAWRRITAKLAGSVPHFVAVCLITFVGLVTGSIFHLEEDLVAERIAAAAQNLPGCFGGTVTSVRLGGAVSFSTKPSEMYFIRTLLFARDQ